MTLTVTAVSYEDIIYSDGYEKDTSQEVVAVTKFVQLRCEKAKYVLEIVRLSKRGPRGQRVAPRERHLFQLL